ncbi:hypothetical protein [environmental halophage 1 AAJ-2005]|nr:hypothetical protein [environmental halophage 1 AAJ-2005]
MVCCVQTPYSYLTVWKMTGMQTQSQRIMNPDTTYRDEGWLRDEYVNKQRSTTEIADELDIAVSTVSRWLGNHGIGARSENRLQREGNIEPLKDESWLRHRYVDENQTQSQIASSLAVSQLTVRKWVDKHGIDLPQLGPVASGEITEGSERRVENEPWLTQQYHGESKTPAEIATTLNLTEGTVRYWLTRHLIEPRHQPGDPEELTNETWLRSQYQGQAQTAYEISEQLGVTSQMVYRRLRRYGIVSDDTPF